MGHLASWELNNKIELFSRPSVLIKKIVYTTFDLIFLCEFLSFEKLIDLKESFRIH